MTLNTGLQYKAARWTLFVKVKQEVGDKLQKLKCV